MNSPPSTQQNQQELESRDVSDQRTEAETEEQPPERKLSVSTITEKGEDEKYGTAGADVKTLKFHMVNWKVKEIAYNQELQGYLTIHGFTRRIEKFNSTSSKLRIYQMMMVFSWIFVSLILIVSIGMIKSVDENASLERIICGIFLSKIIVGLFAYYLFVLRKGKQQVNYLNNLLEEFNKKDTRKNVNWKLITSDENVDNKCNKMCLSIELGPPPTYQEPLSVPEPSRVISIHDYKTNSIIDIRKSIVDVDVRNSIVDIDVRNSIVDIVDVRNSTVDIADIRESMKSVNSLNSVDNCQIRTAVKTRYFYEALPSIPPPAYYVSVGKNRCADSAILNEKVGADDNIDDESTSSFRTVYFETRSSL